MTATQEAQYAGQGYLTPLNDLIKENMPNFSALMENDPQIEKLISQNDRAGDIYQHGNRPTVHASRLLR